MNKPVLPPQDDGGGAEFLRKLRAYLDEFAATRDAIKATHDAIKKNVDRYFSLMWVNAIIFGINAAVILAYLLLRLSDSLGVTR